VFFPIALATLVLLAGAFLLIVSLGAFKSEETMNGLVLFVGAVLFWSLGSFGLWDTGKDQHIGKPAGTDQLEELWTYQVIWNDPNGDAVTLVRPDGALQLFTLEEELCVGTSYTYKDKGFVPIGVAPAQCAGQ